MINAIVTPIKDAIAGMTLFDPDTTDTRLAGLVIPVTRKDPGKSPIVFPVSCDVDGAACYEQGRYFDLLPNDRYRAVIYFEQLSDVQFTGYKATGGKDRIMQFGAQLRLVGWLNAKKLGSTDCSITARLVLGILKALTATVGETSREHGRLSVADAAYTNAAVEVRVARQTRRDPAIFARYTLKETELLYPWDYFALELDCVLQVGRECFDEVTAGEEILC